jgi:hypothetical protein
MDDPSAGDKRPVDALILRLLHQPELVATPEIVEASLGATMPTNWRRRYKVNVERLKSGDPHRIAVVVAGLSERDRRYGLSQGERRMLERAKQMLEGPADDGPAGVREPRGPRPPANADSIAVPEPSQA